MENSHPILPGPRATEDYISTSYASYPPAPRRWSGQAPTSQSRGGYTSPDPSPIAETPFLIPEIPKRDYAFRPTNYFGFHAANQPLIGHTDRQHDAGGLARRQSDAPHFHRPQYQDHYHAQMRAAAMGYKSGHVQEADPFFYPVMPQRPIPVDSNQSKRGKGRRVDGKQPTFLTKLYQILDEPEYAHIIRWDEVGEVIIIEKPDELAAKILPLVYRQSRFASFSRQLNIYGFMRKVSLRHVDRGICDPDASTWSHPFLRRSSTAAEIQGFKRRVPPRPSQSQKRRASSTSSYHDDHTGYGLSPTSSEGSYHSPPDAYQHHLLHDVDEEKPTVFMSPPNHGLQFNPSSPESGGEYHMHMGGRPIPQQHAHLPTVNLPATFASTATNYYERDSIIPSGIPASAPAHIASFPANMQIAQGHIRTRSVQGEPPSATLFSPNAPMDQGTWGSETVDPRAKGDGGPPTYQTNEPSTWFRRGYTDINTGALIAAPSDRPTVTPASLPNHFVVPQYVSPTDPCGPSAATNHPPPVTPSTVSPGVYQAGFSVPAYTPAYMPPSPRAAPSRSERRGSTSSSPYSPRSKPHSGLSLGPIRNIQRRNFGSAESRNRDTRLSPDEALPSAGVEGLHRGPFDGMLSVEGDASLDTNNTNAL